MTPTLLDELATHAPRGFRFTPNPDLPAEPCGYCAMAGATVVVRVYGRPHDDDPFPDYQLDGCRDCAPAILTHMHGSNATDHDLEAEYRP